MTIDNPFTGSACSLPALVGNAIVTHPAEPVLLVFKGKVVYTGKCFSGVYGWKNHLTEKWYVGESIHVPNRVSNYLTDNLKGQPLISSSLAKHGSGNFSCYKLEECPMELLHEREVYWSQQLNSMSPHGYNLRVGGCGKSLVSDETRKSISFSKKGKKISPRSTEHCANLSAVQRVSRAKPEYREKRRSSALYRYSPQLWTEEYRQKRLVNQTS